MSLLILDSTAISRISVSRWLILCGAMFVFVSATAQAVPIAYLFDKDQIEEINRRIREKGETNTNREDRMRKDTISREARLSGRSDNSATNDSTLMTSANPERRIAPKSK